MRGWRAQGRNVLATLRNRLIHKFLIPAVHEWVLWMDADVTQYPPNLVQLLHTANPTGVTAPLVLIQSTGRQIHFLAISHAQAL